MEQLLLAAVSAFALKALAFVLLIGILVVIHEWGHYIMSKRGGVPVEEFAIGFGPVIARLGQKDETVFNLRALPLGGFVRTVGMEPGDETPGGYNTKPIWTRAKIISAGAIINLVFGFLLVVILGMTWGLPSMDDVKVGVQGVQKGSPAEQAGMKKGDFVISINGKTVENPKSLQDEILSHPNVPVELVVRRDATEVPLTAVPKAIERDGKTVGQLGFEMSEEPVWHKYGFTKSIAMGVERSYDMARQILVSLTSASTYKERQLGGPILIAQAAGGSAEKGINYYLWFMAILSINLGVLNLLPLPVLDGGHLVLLGIEAVRRRRPSAQFVMAFQGIGMAILFLFFVFVMASDIMRLSGG